VADIRFETALRRSGKNYTATLDRRTGSRTVGVVFPSEMSADAWESSLQALSEEQGLSPEGHSVEARQRREEPTADAATTTRTLARRG
jgi:thiamine biosynthesis lipoprotein ApbE